MKKIVFSLLALSTIVGNAICLSDSPIEELYGAYRAKSSKKIERAFKEGRSDLGSKTEQLKALELYAKQKGDFSIYKRVVKERAYEKLAWAQKHPDWTCMIGFGFGAIAALVLLRTI